MSSIKPTISIFCITYNQASYIAEALDSLLMQEIDVPFEIIVHDDASTDNTAEIIRQYYARYPDIIVPILQKENQYSKGMKIVYSYIYPKVRGKYIALCEGDDFWTDRFKLKKQYEYMEGHPECAMCMHDGWLISEDKKIVFPSKPLSSTIHIYQMEDAIMGLGKKVVTNSFFYRSDVAKMEVPQFAKTSPTGDYIWPVQSAMYGNICYLPEKMSAHRIQAKNSWSSKMKNNPNKDALWKRHNNRKIQMFSEMDAFFDFRYTEIIRKEVTKQMYGFYVRTKDMESLKMEPYRTMYKNRSFKSKVKDRVPCLFSIIQAVYFRWLEIKSRNWKYDLLVKEE